jgi:hypothetical protein
MNPSAQSAAVGESVSFRLQMISGEKSNAPCAEDQADTKMLLMPCCQESTKSENKTFTSNRGLRQEDGVLELPLNDEDRFWIVLRVKLCWTCGCWAQLFRAMKLQENMLVMPVYEILCSNKDCPNSKHASGPHLSSQEAVRVWEMMAVMLEER